MKFKVIYIAIIIVSLVLSAIPALENPGTVIQPETTERNEYPLTAIVTETDESADIVIAEDASGNIWSFYGVEDWITGDVCSLIMDDYGTEDIRDDIILNARYSGYNAENFQK